MKKWAWVIAAAVLAVAAAGGWLGLRPQSASGRRGEESYQFATVTRGSIESVVSASGTLSAVSTVNILSQMSGRVEKVYVDYNDPVKKGQVLVALSTDMLKLEEKEALAAVRKAQANYDLQRLDFQNKESLAQKGLIADYDLQSSRTTLQVRAAELAGAEVSLEVIQTKLNQYALITSPIDGTVLDRNVEAGQSVVEGSSSNASSLFTLAEDLAQMEIKAEVDELDITSIRVGQAVRFSVEAAPQLPFTGTVREIRLVPESSDNVVTYFVMIGTDNPQGTLLPGMTAQIEFIKEQKSDVLVVPSAAFRFQPTGLSQQRIQEMIFEARLAELPAAQREAALKAAEGLRAASQGQTDQRSGGLTSLMSPRGPGLGTPAARRSGANGGSGAPGGSSAGQNRKSLWYLDDKGQLAVSMVRTGASDGTNTELVGAEALEGRQIIVKVKVQ